MASVYIALRGGGEVKWTNLSEKHARDVEALLIGAMDGNSGRVTIENPSSATHVNPRSIESFRVQY